MQLAAKAALLRHLQASPPGKLLDFPAGTGWLRHELGADRWDYHGADLFTRPDVPNFNAADLNRPFPYEDNEFDYVTCLEGIEHVENYHHLLRQCHRVLKPGGSLLISTPNPLNIKSRRRYYWCGNFYGFPHLVEMPAPGEHVHVTPVNLSSLLAFADKYGLSFQELHPMPIKPGMYRYLLHALAIQAYTFLRHLRRPPKQRAWMQRLASWSVLLNDGVLVSLKKERPCSRSTRQPRTLSAREREAGPNASLCHNAGS